ncbi:PREDICTED: somatic embryogenesis receptor kinase 2-like isoform X2 [Populus euphratica]|uniref:Somatic embryogenesis receptor kinase 2-like isoform X2 n=1 Tax=Populus euphratica TaxID=75702 RepID=A0AAJ6U9V2_POPEU|nr:PREDICTED: somatic embryogenesis receptor kinase 2-like isoform X2 [Populus euphratica]
MWRLTGREFRTCLAVLILVTVLLSKIFGNEEGDALYIFRNNLQDPNNVMDNWNRTDKNPCKWNHVTCNSLDSVVRLDMGNALLSGQLVPQLALLTNLQYLELYANNLSGHIPVYLENLTNLVSLELYTNNFDGPIPDALGKLFKLRFLDLSSNRLSGPVPQNGSFSLFTAISYANNLDLCGPIIEKPCPGSSPPAVSSPDGDSKPNIGAIVGGVVAVWCHYLLLW